MEYFVTGIDTNAGKTVVSAALCHVLGADYWKPVQSGDLDNTDSMKVKALAPEDTHLFPERYQLTRPMSPHASAALDGIKIELSQLQLPSNARPLIVEGAGGIMVPLNEDQTILDLLLVWNIPTIVVTRNYLGSINHTLLSLEVLQQRGVPVAGIIVNGEGNRTSEAAIERMSGIPVLCRIPTLETLDRWTLATVATEIRSGFLAALEDTYPLRQAIEQRVRLVC
ncbi:MAG: hypothetical protein RL226_1129 [Bacteroidota bacterium]